MVLKNKIKLKKYKLKFWCGKLWRGRRKLKDLKKILGNLSTLVKTLILESKLLFVAYSFISYVIRKPTRGLILETNKSWNSCFTAIRKKKTIWYGFFISKKKKNERKEIKGMNMCEKWQLTDLEIEIKVEK